jgi:hypothetical protein
VPIALGTRTPQRGIRLDSRAETRTHSADKGAPFVQASITFANSTSKATAAASTFAGFQVNLPVLIEGTALNNGLFTVTATDASTYLTLSPAPENEGPITATIRKP